MVKKLQMIEITKENQIQEFLDNLTDDEHCLIWACYNALYHDFNAMLEVAINPRNPEFKKDIPSLKRLANFERKFKVKLYQLLDIPGMVYEGQLIPMCESVLLPVGTAKNGETIDVQLGPREQLCLHIRDSRYAGSWESMIKDETPCEHCLATINNLINYESKHKVNLGVLMREWVPLKSEHKKKKKIKK